MRLTLKIDQKLWDRLMVEAEAERRPLAWQAEVLLRRAVDLPPSLQSGRAIAPADNLQTATDSQQPEALEENEEEAGDAARSN